MPAPDYTGTVQGANEVDYDVNQFIVTEGSYTPDAWKYSDVGGKCALRVTSLNTTAQQTWYANGRTYSPHARHGGAFVKTTDNKVYVNNELPYYVGTETAGNTDSLYRTEYARIYAGATTNAVEQVFQVPTSSFRFYAYDSGVNLPVSVPTFVGFEVEYISNPLRVGAQASAYTYFADLNTPGTTFPVAAVERFVWGVVKRSTLPYAVNPSDVLFGIISDWNGSGLTNRYYVNGLQVGSNTSAVGGSLPDGLFEAPSFALIGYPLSQLDVRGSKGSGSLGSVTLSNVSIPAKDVKVLCTFSLRPGVSGFGDVYTGEMTMFSPPAGAASIEIPRFWTSLVGTYEVP